MYSPCLKTATHTTDAIKELKLSTNATKLCNFSKSCNVFHQFVCNFASARGHIAKKLNKGQTIFFILTAKELKGTCDLQDKLKLPPVFVLPYAEEKRTP